MMHALALGRSTPLLTVEDASGGSLERLPAGASLVLGSPDSNPLAAAMLDARKRLVYGFGDAIDAHGGRAIVDRRSGRVFEPSYLARPGVAELVHDFGLVTMMRVPSEVSGEPERIVINAAGVHAAGLAGAMSCLTKGEHIAALVELARRVICGNVSSAQWLIPCDGTGRPILSKIRAVSGEMELDAPRLQPQRRAPKAGVAIRR